MHEHVIEFHDQLLLRLQVELEAVEHVGELLFAAHAVKRPVDFHALELGFGGGVKALVANVSGVRQHDADRHQIEAAALGEDLAQVLEALGAAREQLVLLQHHVHALA